jgi:hypothetical protein
VVVKLRRALLIAAVVACLFGAPHPAARRPKPEVHPW